MSNRIILCIVCFLFLSCRATKPFKLVVLPDTQSYLASNPQIFKSQIDWIVEHSGEIKFVLQEGDLTQNNNDTEWQTVADILGLMDGKVPYTFAPGNHDMGSSPGKFADIRNTDLMNKYLPYSKFEHLSDFGGAFEKGKMDNTWHHFKAGKKNWIILSLEFGVRNEVLEWASKVIENHPKDIVIINTHNFLYSDNTLHGSKKDHKHLVRNYGIGKTPAGPTYANEGFEVWEKLVSKYPNIKIVFNGHVTVGKGTGRLVSTGDHGNKVYLMLANYQKEIKDSEQGTTGYFRIVTFDVKKKIIGVKTYSPWKKSFREDDDHQYEFHDVDFSK